MALSNFLKELGNQGTGQTDTQITAAILDGIRETSLMGECPFTAKLRKFRIPETLAGLALIAAMIQPADANPNCGYGMTNVERAVLCTPTNHNMVIPGYGVVAEYREMPRHGYIDIQGYGNIQYRFQKGQPQYHHKGKWYRGNDLPRELRDVLIATGVIKTVADIGFEIHDRVQQRQGYQNAMPPAPTQQQYVSQPPSVQNVLYTPPPATKQVIQKAKAPAKPTSESTLTPAQQPQTVVNNIINVNDGGTLNLPGNGKSDSFFGATPATPEQQKDYSDWWEILAGAGLGLVAGGVAVAGWKAVSNIRGNKGKDPYIIRSDNL